MKINEAENIVHSLPVFDSLTHITPTGKWFETHHRADINRLINLFNKQIKKALLVGMPGDDHAYLKMCCDKYSEKFIGIGAIDIHDFISIELIEKKIIAYKEIGFKGVKIHPRLLNTNLAHPTISKIIQISGKHNLVSLLCTVHTPPAPPLKRPIFDIVHQICDENIDSKIIFLHGGYYDLLPTSEIIRRYKNALLDLSATLLRYHQTSIFYDMCFLLKTLDRQLCIGSDFPEATIIDVLNVFSEKIIPQFEISKDKLYNIFYGNLAKYFYLGD
jgi:predicted TIM-barrel fold metal-dependent hydrolase